MKPSPNKILLIEDNQMLREMIRRRLRRRGFQLAIAGDGEIGLASAQTMEPDLILLDMSLPGLDGWSVAASLKASPDTARIPIIALTAHAMHGDREKALEAGCDDYLTKPIDFDLLTKRINHWLAG